MDLNKLENETELQYIWRVGMAKDSGCISATWDDLADIFNKNLREDASEYYTSSAYRKRFYYAKRFYDEVFVNMETDDGISRRIKELQKERAKLKTEKLETNRWIREEARDEMITEKIVEAISRVTPLEIPELRLSDSGDTEYLLTFADCHYGIEFDIKDLFGNTINEYSPEIFEDRMWELLDQVRNIIEKENIQCLNVWELGDGIQGIIRLNSQLMKLRYGIIDSSIYYAFFISDWLNELSKLTRVKYQMVIDSNHNQLRICNAPKNSFSEENMSKVILMIIKERLKDNPNISIFENPTGMDFDYIAGYQVLGIHGEVASLSKSVGEFSKAYNTQIDYLIGAHVHHSASEEVGVNSEAIQIRSIIGVDPYGVSLNKVSNAGASLFCFTEDKGLTCEYKIKL